jgi:twitching motility protein PilT
MTWTQALSSVLREDPDVVYVGEIRDLETMKAALTIAETGHLVFSTLHTSSTPEAVHRIIDIFPPHQQNQVRNQLSAALKVVVFQKLVPDANQQSRVPALEILINTSAVAANIREDKIHMLDNIIETGEEFGMVLFERYLAKLYSQGKISRNVAHSYAIRPNEIKKFIT